MRHAHRFSSCFEILEARALLSGGSTTARPGVLAETKGRSMALVGSIQGTETFRFIHGFEIAGSGTVSPLGSVSAAGSLLYGNKGAVNSHGTLALSNAEGSVTLGMTSTQGYVLKNAYTEEIPVSVDVQSATGGFQSIRDSGTMNLVESIPPGSHLTAGTALLTIKIKLQPVK